jgi:hypothetical protein
MGTKTKSNEDSLFKEDPKKWLVAIPDPVAQRRLWKLIEKSSGDEAAKQMMIAAFGPARRGFTGKGNGGGPGMYARLKVEFDKFMCGHPDYDADRKAILEPAKKNRVAIVVALAATIGSTLGVVAGLLTAPLVALLIAMGNVGRKAYCSGVTFEPGKSKEKTKKP